MKKLLSIALLFTLSISDGVCMTEPQSPTWADLQEASNPQGYISSDDEIFTHFQHAQEPALPVFSPLNLDEASLQQPPTTRVHSQRINEIAHSQLPQTITQSQALAGIKELNAYITKALTANNSNRMRLLAISVKVVAHKMATNWISMYFQANLDLTKMPFDYALTEATTNTQSNPDTTRTALTIAQYLYNALPKQQQQQLKEISHWKDITKNNPDIAQAVGQYMSAAPAAIDQQTSMTPTNPLRVEPAEASQSTQPKGTDRVVETNSCWCC